MKEFMLWLAQQSPGWIFMIFPLMIGSAVFGCWREYRKQVKLERNPNLMDENEYEHFNNKRMDP